MIGAVAARDTPPEALERQAEILRSLGARGRFERMRSLSRTTMALAQRAIRRAHPAATEDELLVAFVAVHHGDELAQRLQRYLRERRR